MNLPHRLSNNSVLLVAALEDVEERWRTWVPEYEGYDWAGLESAEDLNWFKGWWIGRFEKDIFPGIEHNR